jgi:hypothetical protein
MKQFLVILAFVFCFFSNAQVIDKFTDGNITADPIWIGDDSLFHVNEVFQLQSKGPIGKDISLSTASSTINGEWNFWCRFNLSPSTSNFMKVYLMSDTNNLKGQVNGYYVQLGGVTGSTDSITLYKQKGNTRTRIIGGRAGTVSKSNNTVRVKVLRNADGDWQLFSDTLGGTNYILEGIGVDNEFVATRYFGVFVKFTASNAQNYYVDDMYAGPEIVDTSAPVLDSVGIVSATQLRLVFNENLEPKSALNAGNHSVNNGIGNAVSAQFENGRTDIVLLTLGNVLTNNTYEVTANNISDVKGNMAAIQQMPFIYYVFNAQVANVLISEFFPDPTPVLNLPEHEFIELYNNTNAAIQLQGWTISDGTSTVVFPNVSIDADSFLIVCASGNTELFSLYGKTVGLTSLPSLNNSNDQIILKDNFGKVIHQLSYNPTWYVDNVKSEGGYSIEMNNPKRLCIGKQNFGVSDNVNGGTPGTANSRWTKALDARSPLLISANAIDDKTIQLVFNEPMDSALSQNVVTNFTPINSVSKRTTNSELFDSLLINVQNSFTRNISSLITISGAKDCSGNIIDVNSNSFSFTYFVADTTLQYDVLINEVLPNPEVNTGLPDAEYIELYNRSNRIISLKNWTLSDAGTTAIFPKRILMPDSFLVITSSANLPKFSMIENVIGIDRFPSLGNDEDALILKNNEGYIIHYLHYTSAAYRDNIKKNGGWSLELIDKNNPCGGSSNLLASINKQGGTPGKVNSVKGAKKDLTSPKLLNAYPLNNNSVELRFNEALDSISQKSLLHFYANGNLNNPVSIRFYPPAFNKVTITFSDSFRSETIYRALLNDIKDCAGNIISDDDYADFGLPGTIDSNDLVINEILFDPRGSGNDFVELFNRSDKILDLKPVYIANTNDDNTIKDFYPIDTLGILIFPQSYLAVTDNPSNILLEYNVKTLKHLLQSKIPVFPNDAGTCALINLEGMRYDEFVYNDDMHFALLDTKDGVSLERIDFNRPTNDKSNWTSASSTSGYATPTYQNSQYATIQSNSTLKADPEVFSPDGDGYNDIVNFSYMMYEPGYAANFYIYNSLGKMVKHLLRNEILGTSGVFSWDGITSDGTKAPIGIYICYFEFFNLKGEVIKKKITTVVGAKI